MTDRELLEAAARAAGMPAMNWWAEMGTFTYRDATNSSVWWSPLENDGDALRLAVKLQLDVLQGSSSLVQVVKHQTGAYADEPSLPDRASATRRAIVRAAASLSRTGEGE